jgi:opacity protein-like surface antigen
MIPRIFVILCAVSAPSLTQAAAVDAPQVVFGAAIVYGPRDIAGTVFVDRAGPASGLATADSLGLGTATSVQLRLAAGYKRWRVALDYLPTQYSGDGFADVDINIGDLPPISAQTPVRSDIDVNLLLLNLRYDVFRTDRWTTALGFGLGQTDVDLALVPAIGRAVAFDSKTPFGYIGGDIEWRFANRWSARGGLQWISGEFDGSRIDYGNYNIAIAYRLNQKRFLTEIVGGYRRVDFTFDYSVPGDRIVTDLSIEGPYLGFSVGW